VTRRSLSGNINYKIQDPRQASSDDNAESISRSLTRSGGGQAVVVLSRLMLYTLAPFDA